jgi:hypothetical protein
LQFSPHTSCLQYKITCAYISEKYNYKLACQNNRNWLIFKNIRRTWSNLYISKHLRVCHSLNIPPFSKFPYS